jgi:nucleotidyltransferase/DNA polymerase involved in DNA repair
MEELRRPELVGKPSGILDPRDTRRLWQVSALARRAGVQVGLTVSQAIGLCSSMTLLEADPVFYDEQFSRLVSALGNFSPVIEPVELGRVYIGVDGVDRLYGTPERQLAVVRRIIARCWQGRTDGQTDRRTVGNDGQAGQTDRQTDGQSGSWEVGKSESLAKEGIRASHRTDKRTDRLSVCPSVRLGWARGKFAAWAATKQSKPGEATIVVDAERSAFLAQQSVATLPVEPDTLRRLWQLGIKTLRDLATLPQEAVVSQYGREGRTAWQLAAGYITEPVVGRENPEPISITVDFPLPVADSSILGNALDKLIERALRHPRRIGWRVYIARIRAALEHGSSWLVVVTLKEPSADAEHIAAPLKVKLEQSPPTGAVESMTLEFVEFVPGTKELQLFTRDASSAARAGRRRALRWAAQEIRTRLKRPMLHHIIEVHPWSRLPERRYALIDFDP